LHIKEIVLDASSTNEGALAGGDKLIHPRLQSSGEDLGDQLCKHVNQANGAVVGDLRGHFIFWNEHIECSVEVVEGWVVEVVELVEGP
jgi:hypothetical protein